MINLNSIHFTPYEFGIDFFGLVIFSLGAMVVISILLFYYNRIPKSSKKEDNLQNPIYQYNDVLLQTRVVGSNHLSVEKTTSTWVKMVLYLVIAIVIFTPFYKLIGVNYFI